MNCCVIAIAGPSGSGKSLFAETLCERISSVSPGAGIVLLKEDAYYRDQSHLSLEERDRVNYDHPDAIEHDLLIEQLLALREGQAVDTPIYDFSVHNRSQSTLRLESAPVIIVEGILLLSIAALRPLFDMKLFMATPLDLCLLRRTQRDVLERGRTVESVLSQYENTVRPMYEEYIGPSARHADLLIARGARNSVALDLLEGNLRDLLGRASGE